MATRVLARVETTLVPVLLLVTARLLAATTLQPTRTRRSRSVRPILISLLTIIVQQSNSLALLQSVIATGFANDGQDQPTAGQVASATSTNNFINFCATVPNKQITNGLQIKEGSCNPAPLGVIASTANMPSCKFVFPKNGQTIAANQDFTLQMAIRNLNTGFFTNPNQNYFAAPQTVDGAGNINGHSHVVIERINSLDQTTPTDPTQFVFFKGLNDKAQNGVLSATVPGGLPAGVYRMASINSSANHQPALVAVAQHGSLDDIVYVSIPIPLLPNVRRSLLHALTPLSLP